MKEESSKQKRAHKKERLRQIPKGEKDRSKLIERWFYLLFLLIPLLFFAKFLTGSYMLPGSDWLLAGYARRHWMASYIASHLKVPMWFPFTYSGRPTVATFFGDVFYPTTILRLFIPTYVVWTYTFIFHLFLAGAGTYVFLRSMKISSYSALIGGLVYMTSGSLVSLVSPGHDGKLICASLMPFFLLFLHRGLLSKRLSFFIFAGAVQGSALLSGHFQAAYYSMLVAGCYTLFQVMYQVQKEGWKTGFRLLLFSCVGLVTMMLFVAVQYLPVYKALPYGARGEGRGYEYSTSWSKPTIELVDMAVPDFSGILDRYWGENYFALHNDYLGMLPLLLVVVALLYARKSRYTKFFIWLGIGGILLSLGGHTPFFRIPYYLLPGFKKFRAPGMAFFIVSFSIAMLSGFGLEAIREKLEEARGKTWWRTMASAFLAIAGLFVLFLFICLVGRAGLLSFLKSHFAPIFKSQYGEALAQRKIGNLYGNYPYFLNGLGRAVVLFLLNASLLLLVALRKIKMNHFLFLIVPLFLMDQWIVQRNFIKTVPPPKTYYAPDEVVTFLTRDHSLFRVFPLQYEHKGDAYLSLFNIENIGGTAANPPKYYQELIGAERSVMFNAPALLQNERLLDLLNVKYVISVPLPDDVSQYDEENRRAIAFLRRYLSRFELVNHGRYSIYKNGSVLPRAFLVPQYEVLAEDEAALARVQSPDFDPRRVVILSEAPNVLQPDFADTVSEGDVKILVYEPNEITCQVHLSSPSFLFLSENYFPDWTALVDGKASKIFRANYAFRAVHLNEGEHTVRFVFDSTSYNVGKWVSIVTFLFILGCIVLEVKGVRQKDRGGRHLTQ